MSKIILNILPILVSLAIPFIYEYIKVKEAHAKDNDEVELTKKIIMDFFTYNNILKKRQDEESFSQFGHDIVQFSEWLNTQQKQTKLIKLHNLINLASKIVILLYDRFSSPDGDNSSGKLSYSNLEFLYEVYESRISNIADPGWKKELHEINNLIDKIKDF